MSKKLFLMVVFSVFSLGTSWGNEFLHLRGRPGKVEFKFDCVYQGPSDAKETRTFYILKQTPFVKVPKTFVKRLNFKRHKFNLWMIKVYKRNWRKDSEIESWIFESTLWGEKIKKLTLNEIHDISPVSAKSFNLGGYSDNFDWKFECLYLPKGHFYNKKNERNKVFYACKGNGGYANIAETFEKDGTTYVLHYVKVYKKKRAGKDWVYEWHLRGDDICGIDSDDLQGSNWKLFPVSEDYAEKIGFGSSEFYDCNSNKCTDIVYNVALEEVFKKDLDDLEAYLEDPNLEDEAYADLFGTEYEKLFMCLNH